MRGTVEMASDDLISLDITEEQLHEAVVERLAVLQVDGDPIYINELDVEIVLTAN